MFDQFFQFYTHKFLAAPKPPGKTTASWEAALSSAREEIFPRAILADSAKTCLYKEKQLGRLSCNSACQNIIHKQNKSLDGLMSKGSWLESCDYALKQC